jgi:ribose transport system ATP-binding protein
MSNVLELRNITKIYPGVTALDDVSISFKAGEVHSLMGENGAGKSTLIKIIAGAVSQDSGEIVIGGDKFSRLTPLQAKTKGIGVIYQEFNLVPSLNVAENVFLGDKIGGNYVIDKKSMHERTKEILKELNVDIDTNTMVGILPTAKQQMVEIAKAISKNAKILIMDEPSAAISISEVEKLHDIILRLKEKGVTIIYISHRMDEVFEISDRVSIMRDGHYIATKELIETSRKDLINMMVGRELNEAFPSRQVTPGEIVMETKNLCGNGVFDINLNLHKGEILGLAGLIGAGRTELAKLLFGDASTDSGEIIINHEKVKFRKTQDAISKGIGLIPEDRKREGAFLEYPIDWNISIMNLKRLSKWTLINHKMLDEVGNHYQEVLRIKTPSMSQLLKNLSGGNQQKVVMAKVLATQANILIFDEPTRGIDVGAKQEIYKLMNDLIKQGMSIIMISSEMEELIGMSDRIIVLHEGRQTGELSKEAFNQQRILELASGI